MGSLQQKIPVGTALAEITAENNPVLALEPLPGDANPLLWPGPLPQGALAHGRLHKKAFGPVLGGGNRQNASGFLAQPSLTFGELDGLAKIRGSTLQAMGMDVIGRPGEAKAENKPDQTQTDQQFQEAKPLTSTKPRLVAAAINHRKPVSCLGDSPTNALGDG